LPTKWKTLRCVSLFRPKGFPSHCVRAHAALYIGVICVEHFQEAKAVMRPQQVDRIRKKSFLPVDKQTAMMLRRHRSLEDVVSTSQEDLRERVAAADASAVDYDEDYDIALS